MEEEERRVFVSLATMARSDKLSKMAMRELLKENKTYHFCLDFDGLAICNTDGEYQFCNCKPKQQ